MLEFTCVANAEKEIGSIDLQEGNPTLKRIARLIFNAFHAGNTKIGTNWCLPWLKKICAY